MFPIGLVAEHIPVLSLTLGELFNLSSVSLFPSFKLKLLPCLHEQINQPLRETQRLQ